MVLKHRFPFTGIRASKLHIRSRGTEFAGFRALEDGIGACSWFCDPSAPWQKGTVENTNKRIRRYLHGTTDLAVVSQRDLLHLTRDIGDVKPECDRGRRISEGNFWSLSMLGGFIDRQQPPTADFASGVFLSTHCIFVYFSTFHDNLKVFLRITNDGEIGSRIAFDQQNIRNRAYFNDTKLARIGIAWSGKCKQLRVVMRDKL